MGRGWRISVCSDSESWMNAFIPDFLIIWMYEWHKVRWAHIASELKKGDLYCYLGYGRNVKGAFLSRHSNNLGVHASDLSRGRRRWSPLTWKTLEGDNDNLVLLFEAVESVDSRSIDDQVVLSGSGNEIFNGMQHVLGKTITELCRYFVNQYPDVIHSFIYQNKEPTYYHNRRPEDSSIYISYPLKNHFYLLRNVDNEKYSAWFEYERRRYILEFFSQDDSSFNNQFVFYGDPS